MRSSLELRHRVPKTAQKLIRIGRNISSSGYPLSAWDHVVRGANSALPFGQLTRIDRVERVAKAQSKFSANCICFLANEVPQLAFDVECETAAAVKFPSHDVQFGPQVLDYMAK